MAEILAIGADIAQHLTRNLWVRSTSEAGFLGTNGIVSKPDYANRVSDFIPVQPGQQYVYQAWTAASNNWHGYCFYTADKVLTGSRRATTSGTVQSGSGYYAKVQLVAVPSGAAFLRIGSRHLETGRAMLSLGTDVPEYSPAAADVQDNWVLLDGEAGDTVWIRDSAGALSEHSAAAMGGGVYALTPAAPDDAAAWFATADDAGGKIPLALLSFSQGWTADVAVGLSFSQQFRQPADVVLGVSFSQRQAAGTLAYLGFAQSRPAARQRQFRGSQAVGIGDYDLLVKIDGQAVPMCQMAETMTIEHGENESYMCRFVMREQKGVVDVYRWHGKGITVDAVHDGGVMRLYQGVVDVSSFNLNPRKRVLSCTDRRDLLLNALPRQTVESIGITSKSAHGDVKDQAAEVRRRLETVPASFEFDAYGNGYLTPWAAKETPDRVIDDCMIYYREPQVRVAEVARVLNRVNITVSHQFYRLWQRDLRYRFVSGYTVCDYAFWGLPPLVEHIKTAAKTAGWAIGRFQSEGLAPGGNYRCNGSMMMWSPIARQSGNSYQTDADGKAYTDKNGTPIIDARTVSSVDYTNLYATSADWTASKRWTQNRDELYEWTLVNYPSISRYGELSENISYSVRAEDRSESWGQNYDEAKSAPSSFMGANNGDRYLDRMAETAAELAATLRVAFQTAYCKMLDSHRQNTLDLEIKFLPELDLRHTHHVKSAQFDGKAKVSRFVHTLDLRTGLGQTAVQYRFFQNAGNDAGLTAYREPERPSETLWPVSLRYLLLDVKNFGLGQTVDLAGRSGFFTQTVSAATRHQSVFVRGVTREQRRPVAFAVTVPEIEQVQTDTATATRKLETEVAVENNPAVIRMV